MAARMVTVFTFDADGKRASTEDVRVQDYQLQAGGVLQYTVQDDAGRPVTHSAAPGSWVEATTAL